MSPDRRASTSDVAPLPPARRRDEASRENIAATLLALARSSSSATSSSLPQPSPQLLPLPLLPPPPPPSLLLSILFPLLLLLIHTSPTLAPPPPPSPASPPLSPPTYPLPLQPALWLLSIVSFFSFFLLLLSPSSYYYASSLSSPSRGAFSLFSLFTFAHSLPHLQSLPVRVGRTHAPHSVLSLFLNPHFYNLRLPFTHSVTLSLIFIPTTSKNAKIN